ncbi:MAG: exopolyphosphatase [Planctomycetota bacterium]|jgi:exopolyphosphatase/guanosine-5'-triphosphate,3'-diphosphate pyrophosphatase|nr:exopolyphosphatase [Planctomycetota bacterium]
MPRSSSNHHSRNSSPLTGDLAAIDLGSNSFHMVVARVREGHPRIVDRVRDRVALAAGLDENKNLTEEAEERALQCLRTFGQRIRDIPPENIRAVGTNTLRLAANADDFLEEAEEALGFPIEIISGQEEARLVYLGVAGQIQAGTGRRLVIDIGGGSTECIIGNELISEQIESLFMGCVSYTLRYFPRNKISKRRLRKATLAAALEIQSIRKPFRKLGWNACIGSSGTIRAVDRVLSETGWSPGGITKKGLDLLSDSLVEAEHTSQIDLPGLDADRAEVLPGGLAILQAAFDELDIEHMESTRATLREGILTDLLGRLGHDDIREQTVKNLSRTYHVDPEQAARVENTALDFFEQVRDGWKFGEWEKPFLSWAARLHEIGLAISHTGYHKHGAYLLEYSSLPGFSMNDQMLISQLVRHHRRKWTPTSFDELRPSNRQASQRLTSLLRLAVLFHRSRSSQPLPKMKIKVRKKGFKLEVPHDWLESNPLTETDLQEEIQALKSIDIELQAI